MQEYCLQVLISSFIISICILPILLYLVRNKLKFKPKAIYNIYLIICIVLFIPLINISFNKTEVVETKNYTVEDNTENSYYSNNFEAAQILNLNDSKVENFNKKATTLSEAKIETVEIVEQQNKNSISIKNDIIYWFYNWFPKLWGAITMASLLYYFIIYRTYILKLDLVEEKNVLIENIINSHKRDMKIKQNIKYAFSNKINTPITVGILKKKIIIPKEFEVSDYKYIMKHELFHLKNKDVEFKLISLLLEILYFFNPIIKLLTKEVNEIIELNCDYNILEKESDLYRKEYGNILLKQIESNTRKQYKLVTSFASSRRNIMDRFKNILNGGTRKRSIAISFVLITFIIISVISLICVPNVNIAANEKDTKTEVQEVKKDEKSNIEIIETKEDEKSNIEIIETEKTVIEEFNEEKNSKKTEAKDATVSKEVETEQEIEEADTNSIAKNEENKETVENIEKIENKTEDVEIQNNTEKVVEANVKNSVFPLESGYRKTADFGSEAMFSGEIHTGIDYAAKEGGKIFAVMSGKVISSGFTSERGNFITIDHGDGITTTYAHCSEVLKQQNEEVNAGDIIAKVGNTGMSTGPHLHFEVQENGVSVNPANYLP